MVIKEMVCDEEMTRVCMTAPIDLRTCRNAASVTDFMEELPKC